MPDESTCQRQLIAYASRTGTRRNLSALRSSGWRLLVSASGVLRHEGFRYALDNGAWSAYRNGRPFNDRAFNVALRQLGAGADWTVLPDIVAGGPASLDLSLQWMRRVLDESPAALLAVQDGLTAADVRPFIGARVGIFVGGSTAWKLATLRQWCELGRSVGCWVHVGRVNTARRIHLCSACGSRFAVTVPKLDAARKQLSWRF
jgi:hypothetical protein